MQPVFEKTLPEHHRRSVQTHRHTYTHIEWVCELDHRSEGIFLIFFQNDLKLDFSESDFKQVCDIIVNNLFMRGVTQISIIMTTTANHTLYGITFACADLIPL